MSFALGKNMDGNVTTQINTLQRLLDVKRTSSYNAEIAAYYFNAKTPWVKLTSAIEFDSGSRGDAVREFFGVDGNELARQNILFNLDPAQVNTDLPAGSEYSDYYGVRPKPGITGMNINTHNRFGSLRTATVNFICWDPDQLAVMELLYMRPGYSVILEFGHSVNVQPFNIQPFVDNEAPSGSIEWEYARNMTLGNTSTGIVLEDVDVREEVGNYTVQNTSEGIDFFGNGNISTAEDVYRLINTKRKDNNYAYDGVYGIVKNFNWSLRPDGGYNCTTSIVSKGELIESLKVDLSAATINWDVDYSIPIQLLKDANRADVTDIKIAGMEKASIDFIQNAIKTGDVVLPTLEEVKAGGYFPESIPE
jgi:hypothetical protein